jgi:hypothetical protein
MSETADPVAALSDKSVAVRAAGARDLSLTGTPAHLPLLVSRCVGDASVGVRLGAAAAAADILSRARLGPLAATIPAGDREALWGVLRTADPGVNPGIFQVCGTLDVPDAVSRIFGAMRDPRADVRIGACVGLWRHCVSAAVNGDSGLEARVVSLFDDARIKPDTLAELARVASNVGYTAAIEPVRRLSESASRQVAAIAAEALQRLEWPAPLAGVWAELGVDAGEVNPNAKPGDILALTGSDTLVRAGAERVSRAPVEGPVRRIWIKRPGAAEATWAVQLGATTAWSAEPDEITELGDRMLSAGTFDLLALVDPLLPDTSASALLRGVARMRAGDLAGALEYLSAAVEMKKTPIDAWWFLADTLSALGRDAEARPHLERFVARGPKRSPWMAEARRRLGEP